MLMEDRKKYVLKILEEESSVTISHLSEVFGLSEVSVRKLLISMENDGLLKRTWGGAVSVQNPGLSPSRLFSSHIHATPEEEAIAQEAYHQLHDGEAAALTPGTISLALAKQIAQGQRKNLVICTNALPIATELSRNPAVMVLVFGGELRPNTMSCVGGRTISSMSHHYFDKCFIDAPYFSASGGVFCSNPAEADIIRMIAEHSQHPYVMADEKRFQNSSLIQVISPTRIGHLITDWHLTSAQRELLIDQNVPFTAVSETYAAKKEGRDL